MGSSIQHIVAQILIFLWINSITASAQIFYPSSDSLTLIDDLREPVFNSVEFVTHPQGATVSYVFYNNFFPISATPFSASMPSGEFYIRFDKDGYKPLIEKIDIENNIDSFEFWLDKEKQLLHCKKIIECGPAPKCVTITPDKKELWVTLLAGPPSVRIFDLDSGEELNNIELGKNGAVEVIFNREGTLAYVSQMETASVYEIDVESKEVLRNFKTNSSWSKIVELSVDEQKLYVSNWSGNNISEIDLVSGNLIRNISCLKTPRGIYPTPVSQYLYVAGFGKGEIQKINLVDGTKEKIFKGGYAIRHFAADTTNQILYASDMGKNCIWAVNLKTDSVYLFKKTGNKPNTIRLSPDGNILFVSCRGRNNSKSYYLKGPEWGSVELIDTQTGELLDVIIGGNQCTGLDVSLDGRLLVFSDFLDNTIRIYEIPPYDVLKKGNGGRSEFYSIDIKK